MQRYLERKYLKVSENFNVHLKFVMNDDCVLQHTGQSIDYNEITNSFPDKVFIIQ